MAEALVFAAVDGLRRQTRDCDLRFRAGQTEPADDTVGAGCRRVESRNGRDPGSIEFKKAVDRVEPVEGEVLTADIGAKRLRFRSEPSRASGVAVRPYAVQALTVPGRKPPRRPVCRRICR